MGGCQLARPVSAIHAKPQANTPPRIEITKGLDQELPKDAPLARSKCHADGNLFCSVCRTRCEQAAKVGAGSEQNNTGQPHDPSQKATRRSAHKVANHARTGELQCQPLFILRILPGNAGRNGVQFRLRLGRGDPVLDAHDRKEIPIASRLKPTEPVQRCLICYGNENVKLGNLPSRGSLPARPRRWCTDACQCGPSFPLCWGPRQNHSATLTRKSPQPLRLRDDRHRRAPSRRPRNGLMPTTSKYCPLTSAPHTGRVTPLASKPKS